MSDRRPRCPNCGVVKWLHTCGECKHENSPAEDKKELCPRCLEALGKCACENWDDDDPDLPCNKLKPVTPIRGWITDEELNDLLSLPEREYLIDLVHRLLTDLKGFEFTDTDKYALEAVLPKITACMDIQDAPRFNLERKPNG